MYVKSKDKYSKISQYTCRRYGECCECVCYHLQFGSMPNCFVLRDKALAEKDVDKELEEKIIAAEIDDVEQIKEGFIETYSVEEVEERLDISSDFEQKEDNGNEEHNKEDSELTVKYPIFIEVFFRCCCVYGKLYLNIKENYYVGKCPRCKSRVTAPIGDNMPKFGLRQKNSFGLK